MGSGAETQGREKRGRVSAKTTKRGEEKKSTHPAGARCSDAALESALLDAESAPESREQPAAVAGGLGGRHVAAGEAQGGAVLREGGAALDGFAAEEGHGYDGEGRPCG